MYGTYGGFMSGSREYLGESREFAQDTIKSYEETIADPAHEAVEYTLLRDEQGRALLMDGEPVVEFGPEDHMSPDALHRKYDFLIKAADKARHLLPGLEPLRDTMNRHVDVLNGLLFGDRLRRVTGVRA